MLDRIYNPEGEVSVAIVGKYTQLEDAYKSIAEALTHGGMANRVKVNARMGRCRAFRARDAAPYLEGYPRHPRARRLWRARHRRQDQGRAICPRDESPYLGICLGMQMAVIEAARNRGRDQSRQARGIRP